MLQLFNRETDNKLHKTKKKRVVSKISQIGLLDGFDHITRLQAKTISQ